MKKFITLLLAMTLVVALAACGGKQEESADENVIKMGLIDDVLDTELLDKHIVEVHSETPNNHVLFSNLSTALLALEKGEVNALSLTKASAEYIVSRNDKYEMEVVNSSNDNTESQVFSMMTAETNTELHGILDSAIKKLKEDGTLDKLIEEDLNAFIEEDPQPADLPYFEGAKTYKIAVTGDLPPMDFVTADGKAAGFNVALLTEIANIAEVNFELIQVDSGARMAALESGKVDAVFWTIAHSCQLCGEFLSGTPDGMMATEDYFSEYIAVVWLKDK